MLRVTTTREHRSIIWIPVIIATVAMHLGFFYAGVNWAESKPRTPYESSRVEFRALPPTPEPIPEPVVETEKIELPPPEIKVAKKTRPRTPKPNTSTPEPPAEQPDSEPAKAVFGVTADSVTNSGSSVAVRVGNTLAKEMEKAFTKPKNIGALHPAPMGPVAPPQPVKKPIKPVPVYELSKAPTFKHKIEPKYPDRARREGIEGTVHLEILIDEKGRVRKVKVLKSPGHGLERAAISAVSKSKFNPGVINGKAVAVKIKIPYRFVLDA